MDDGLNGCGRPSTADMGEVGLMVHIAFHRELRVPTSVLASPTDPQKMAL